MSLKRVPFTVKPAVLTWAREAAGRSSGEAARTIGDHLVTDRHTLELRPTGSNPTSSGRWRV
jgi:hypothetical protein